MVTPVLWPPYAESWLIGKDSEAGRDWGQEEKGTTEDEMAGWHHRQDGHEFGWTPGFGDGQEGLACCDSWGLKESDTTEWLNRTEAYLDWGQVQMYPYNKYLLQVYYAQVLFKVLVLFTSVESPPCVTRQPPCLLFSSSLPSICLSLVSVLATSCF